MQAALGLDADIALEQIAVGISRRDHERELCVGEDGHDSPVIRIKRSVGSDLVRGRAHLLMVDQRIGAGCEHVPAELDWAIGAICTDFAEVVGQTDRRDT